MTNIPLDNSIYFALSKAKSVDVLENVLSPLNYPCLEPTVCASSMILIYGVNIQSLYLNVL